MYPNPVDGSGEDYNLNGNLFYLVYIFLSGLPVFDETNFYPKLILN